MEAFLVIAICAVLTFWPAVAAQTWAVWAITTKHYIQTDHVPDWLLVCVPAGMVIAMLLMPLETEAFDWQRSYLPAVVFLLAMMIDASSAINAKERVIRARDHGTIDKIGQLQPTLK